MTEITALRRKLAAWHVAVFGAILLLFGLATYLVVARQTARRLDRSLMAAVAAVAEAVGSGDAVWPPSSPIPAPGYTVYAFDADARPLAAGETPEWVLGVARSASSDGEAWGVHDVDDDVAGPERDRAWRLYGRRFVVEPSGDAYVGVAVADVVELEDEYAGVIAGFWVAGLLALAATGVGGYALAGRASGPAAAALERLRSFTADASHQLRTPVAVIRGRAEAALQAPATSVARQDALEEIALEAGRIGDLLDKLLLLARADAGRRRIHHARVHVDDVMFEALSSTQPLARSKAIQVDVAADGDLAVWGDSALLQQMVVVLLDNALKFSPRGAPVTLHAAREANRAVLRVGDAGPGVPREIRGKVFEPFYRGEAAAARTTGAGLGLSIARRIARAHDGEITISCPAEGGTVVTVSLPSAPSSPCKVPPRMVRGPAQAPSPRE